MSGHDHNHQHNHAGSRRSLRFSFFLVAGFMIVEVVGGWLDRSIVETEGRVVIGVAIKYK